MSSANINVNINANAKKAVDNIGKTTKAMKGLKRASGRRGGAAMGLLEASRAIEDFSVAGMRGALNNIPGLAMSLGAGAGLAGAASIAAVALMQLSKVMDMVADKSGAAQMEAFRVEIERQIRALEKAKNSAALKSYVAALEDVADKGLIKFQSSFEEATKLVEDSIKAQRLHEDKINQAKGGLNAYEQAQLSANRAAEDANRIAEQRIKLASEMTRQEKELARLRNSERGEDIERAKREIDSIKGLRAPLAAIIEAGGAERPTRSVLEGVSVKITDAFLKMMGEETIEGFAKKVSLKEAREKDALLAAQLRHQQNALHIAEQEQRITEDTIKNMEKEVSAAQELFGVLSDNFWKTVARKETEEEVAKIIGESSQKKARESIMQSLATSSSGLLGGLASVGLGATEAVNSLNIQKNIFNTLKSIDKSLKGKLAAYASA